MVLLLRRAAIFIAIVLIWALLAAAVAHSAAHARGIAALFGLTPGVIGVKSRVPLGGTVHALR